MKVEEFIAGIVLLIGLIVVLKLASRPLSKWGDMCDRWLKGTRYFGVAVFFSPFVALAAALAYGIAFRAPPDGGSWLVFLLYFAGFSITIGVLLAVMLDLSE